jgi:uncharacterized protein YutE (UPF0331/DUF86 family)
MEKGLISSRAERKWIRMIGFRNMLVHGHIDAAPVGQWNPLSEIP